MNGTKEANNEKLQKAEGRLNSTKCYIFGNSNTGQYFQVLPTCQAG